MYPKARWERKAPLGKVEIAIMPSARKPPDRQRDVFTLISSDEILSNEWKLRCVYHVWR